MQHPVLALWNRHAPTNGYPKGVVAVPQAIPGLAFFPGGYGLWGSAEGKPLPEFPKNQVMVLGHDFHSEVGYQASIERGCESEKMPTWANLLQMLKEVGLAPTQCFFTNIYMGLRAGTATTGVFPGAGDEAFVAHCKQFLLEQLLAQKPKLILTLGIHVPPFVGTLSPQLREWSQGRGLRHLDEKGPVRTNVTFEGIDDFTTTVVALIHPSLRHASLRHRRYGDHERHEAEIQMLKDAIEFSKLTG